MKILKLRFKNLNSLAGEWEIDFQSSEYTDQGIFAITGPTGAGKSTLLDAICLALYGRTPRLDKISKQENEVMSRRTGECLAEVTFSCRDGRYRSCWSQRRARTKPDGELQSAKHELVNDETGEILENSLRGVMAKLPELTGLEYTQFTRSILLAQGSFAAFLQASTSERAPILEQITGTEIYSEISTAVHIRQTEEQTKLLQLEQEMAGIPILTPDEESQTLEDLAAKEKEEAEAAAHRNKIHTAITWKKGINELTQEIQSLSEERSRLDVTLQNFQEDRNKLALANKALPLESAYETLMLSKEGQKIDQTRLEKVQTVLPQLEAAVTAQKQNLKSTEAEIETAKTEWEKAIPLIKQVRALDLQLEERQKGITQAKTDFEKDVKKIAISTKRREETEVECRKQMALQEQVGKYLAANKSDAWLVAGLAGIRQQGERLKDKQKDIKSRRQECAAEQKEIAEIEKRLTELQSQYQTHEQQCKEQARALQEREKANAEMLAGRSLSEYRREKDGLQREHALLMRIAELEAHRTKLEDGKECPLCGSLEHPYAEGNLPVPDETEKEIERLTRLIATLENQEIQIQKEKEGQSKFQEKLLNLRHQKERLEVEKNEKDKKCIRFLQEIQKLEEEFGTLKQNILTALQPLGVQEVSDEKIPELLNSLEKRHDAWVKHLQEYTDVEKQASSLRSQVQELVIVLITQTEELTEKQNRLTTLQEEFSKGQAERQEMYGTKNPDEEERQFTNCIAQAEKKAKDAREVLQEVTQKWTQAESELQTLKKRIEEKAEEIIHRTSAFSTSLTTAGFKDEEQFLQARLSIHDREALDARAKELDAQKLQTETRLKDRRERLEKEQKKEVSDQPLENLESQLAQQEELLKQCREMIANFKHRLAENKKAQERAQGKQALIDAQKRECSRWDKLHRLIGSADGKKFRNFAQGLTFEIMIGHANQQLQKMTDRYLLIRNSEEPLELNVLDQYQAGEKRSTKNLSGGESFIVSLALALGLSQMAGHKIQMDSLFLDEGFGTLDEEALEVALNMLASLHQEEKMIGVISHVGSLKERIPTQIRIIPTTAGRSEIQGPGVQKI